MEETKTKQRRRGKQIRKPTFYTSGEVANLLNCSLRTASVTLDKYPDLTYRVGKVRRITRENFIRLMKRAGFTPAQLGMTITGVMAWVGKPHMNLIRHSDSTLNAFEAISQVVDGRINGVCCVRHSMSANELECLANVCKAKGIRFAASLPDDMGSKAEHSAFAWLFTDETNVDDVVLWVRGEE